MRDYEFEELYYESNSFETYDPSKKEEITESLIELITKTLSEFSLVMLCTVGLFHNNAKPETCVKLSDLLKNLNEGSDIHPFKFKLDIEQYECCMLIVRETLECLDTKVLQSCQSKIIKAINNGSGCSPEMNHELLSADAILLSMFYDYENKRSLEQFKAWISTRKPSDRFWR